MMTARAGVAVCIFVCFIPCPYTTFCSQVIKKFSAQGEVWARSQTFKTLRKYSLWRLEVPWLRNGGGFILLGLSSLLFTPLHIVFSFTVSFKSFTLHSLWPSFTFSLFSSTHTLTFHSFTFVLFFWFTDNTISSFTLSKIHFLFVTIYWDF